MNTIVKYMCAASLVWFITGGSSLCHAEVVVNRLLNCATISDDTFRLRCFDELANDVSVKPPASPVAVKPPPAVAGTVPPSQPAPQTTSTAPAAQSKSPPPAAQTATTPASPPVDPSLPTPGVRTKQPPFITTHMLIDIQKNALGRWVFYLDNGQVWRQVESRKIRLSVTLPVEVKLTKGLLGNYILLIEGRKQPVKVTLY